jgi:hypothetical protein
MSRFSSRELASVNPAGLEQGAKLNGLHSSTLNGIAAQLQQKDK